MDLHHDVPIDAPASVVWQTLGERFMHIGEWAAPITASCPIGDAAPAVGVSRACTVAAFGPMKPGRVVERLTSWRPEALSFEYEAVEGMPAFVEHAVNRWQVVAVDAGRSVVRIHATLTLRGPARLAGCLVKWQLAASGRRVAEELKYFVERGAPHPRKASAAATVA